MAEKPLILIVDDERGTREGLLRALRSKYRILLADSAETALDTLAKRRVDLMLSDIRMPGMSGLDLMERALANYDGLICILLTAYGDIETATKAMRLGAADFLTKPVELDQLELRLDRALDSQKMRRENRILREQLESQNALETMIGESSAMREVFDTIKQVAPTQASVLVEGESGTGKELVARALHKLSPRSEAPFVPVHCAALSSGLLESELFGHEKGAFTGASSRHTGRFEAADGGTLFLDEIAEIDKSVQVKLLRALEERVVERVGGHEPISVDTRLVTATNRDLRKMVADNEFREDLFYRLEVVKIVAPPLRKRTGDIELLLKHFLDQFSRENNKDISGYSSECLDLLTSYEWPGNVRELRNLVESMVVLARGDLLEICDIPARIRGADAEDESLLANGSRTLLEMEKAMIIQALKDNDNSRTMAAEQLGISRRTLHRKIKGYGLK